MTKKFPYFISAVCALFFFASAFPNAYIETIQPLASIEERVQANRRFDGLVIHKGDVPGYSAIFNGDIWPTTDDTLIGLFRMAREGYQKVPADNERGYILKDYYSDIGLFTSHDVGETWEFVRVFVASSHKLEEHINHLYHLLSRLETFEGDSEKIDLTEKVLSSLQSLSPDEKQPNILEDPRFMSFRDGKGEQRFFCICNRCPSQASFYRGR